MDTLSEIRRKMESKNTILVAAATDNLINIIKSKVKGTRTDMTNIPEMLLLQEYCCHQNPIICTTTFYALCEFMTNNNYQNQLLTDWLVVLSPRTKCKTGFIQEIFELIGLWLKNDENINNDHINTLIDILIKIMDENLDEWRVILFHMKVHTNFDNYELIKKWLVFTTRLFKFIFLSRTPSSYRTSFVRLFVEIICITSKYDLLFEIYSWLQVDNLDDVLFSYNFLEEFFIAIPDTLHEVKFNLCLCIIQTSNQLISYGYDPTQTLQCLNKLLINYPCVTDFALLCMSKTLSLCSSKFLLKIMNFCLQIIQNYGCHKIIAQSVVASILQWNRTNLIDENTLNVFLSTANSDMIVHTYQSRLCKNNHKLFPFLTTGSIFITYSLTRLCSEFNDKKFISKWLSGINQTSELLIDTQINFYLAGIYLSKIGDRPEQQIILKLLNKKILLPLIAYALDIETNYHNRFDLMKIIPTAACVQDNMSLIINLIKRFENCNEEALNILSIDMYYDLWITEVRCYRFLLYCLSKEKPGWQWNVVKSYTIKQIIKLNPNSDLIAVLKQMLGFYTKRSMYLPMKLTLESLVDLCATEFLNPESLLKIIDKNINDIHHVSVISSYCNLLAISANQVTEKAKSHDFLSQLWALVLYPNDHTVKCALKSLSNINLESMPLHVLPEKFQSFSKIVTQLEDLEKIDIYNGPIPGECWVKFLQSINNKFLHESQLMLSVWLRQELEKNIISRVQSDQEPKNLKHLSNHSIARGLMSFVVPKRKKMLDEDIDTKVACLAIINGADKPMYPFDWGFLEKYITDGPQNKLWKESVVLIAKQSTKSTSAFRLLYKCYNYQSNFDITEIKLLITMLSNNSSIIYHSLQKKFVVDIINEVLNNIINEEMHTKCYLDTDLLCHFLITCKQILQNHETEVENINFICNILENIWCTINLENKKILHTFLECCLSMPTEVLENLRPYPVQESMLLKFIILCCTENIIYSNISFVGFTESIQACAQFSKEYNILYDLIIEVFKQNIFVPYHHELIGNFMVYLASFTKQTNVSTNNSFCVLCSIFINLIVTLSGYNSIGLINNQQSNHSIFPLALVTFSKNLSQSSRTIEWLKTMRTIQSLPEEYSKLFYCCLVAFKNDTYLLEWTNKQKIILN